MLPDTTLDFKRVNECQDNSKIGKSRKSVDPCLQMRPDCKVLLN